MYSDAPYLEVIMNISSTLHFAALMKLFGLLVRCVSLTAFLQSFLCTKVCPI